MKPEGRDRGASAEDALLLVAVDTLLVAVGALHCWLPLEPLSASWIQVAWSLLRPMEADTGLTLGTLDPGGMIDGQQKLVVSGQPMNNGMDATAIV